MIDRLRRKLTYANVMATIAVFGVLVGGGAYAASKLGAGDIAKNAIRSKHIKKNAVKAKKIADGAVTAGKLSDGSVVAQKLADLVVAEPKLADQAVTAAKIADGAVTDAKLANPLRFAYVAFNSPADYALEYGRGAVSVTNQNAGRIDVRFNRPVEGCAAHVTPGNPDPHDDDLDFFAIPSVHVDPDEIAGSEDDVIRVILRRANGDATDTSFLITLVC